MRHFTLLDIIGMAFFFYLRLRALRCRQNGIRLENRRQVEVFGRSQGNVDNQESVTPRVLYSLLFLSIWDIISRKTLEIITVKYS